MQCGQPNGLPQGRMSSNWIAIQHNSMTYCGYMPSIKNHKVLSESVRCCVHTIYNLHPFYTIVLWFLLLDNIQYSVVKIHMTASPLDINCNISSLTFESFSCRASRWFRLPLHSHAKIPRKSSSFTAVLHCILENLKSNSNKFCIGTSVVHF